jgi:hypothetical protein
MVPSPVFARRCAPVCFGPAQRTEHPLLQGHRLGVLSLAFAPHTSRFVSGSLDGAMRLRGVPRTWESWATSVRRPAWSISPVDDYAQRSVLRGHEASVNAVAVIVDGRARESGQATIGPNLLWTKGYGDQSRRGRALRFETERTGSRSEPSGWRPHTRFQRRRLAESLVAGGPLDNGRVEPR